MKSACVFGGAGFLGSHVADVLTEAGFAVRIYDRVPSPWLQPCQQMVTGDLLDYKAVESAVSGADVVYNFAALADLNEGLTNPLDTIRINILGNAHIMEACRKHNVRRFVYASTVYVYSRSGGFYRCSKQSAEHYVEEYQIAYGLNFTILRYGSLYGPRANISNGLYRIVKSALETGVVRYEGSSEALREYIHVDDAARASVIALGEEFCNQSVILTGQEPMKVLDLLEMLAEILDYKNPVEFIENDQAGHYVRTPYAYQPKLGRKFIPPMHVDLGQGLIQLIEEVRNHLENR
jgi:UDP-glucose 4-epimerase